MFKTHLHITNLCWNALFTLPPTHRALQHYILHPSRILTIHQSRVMLIPTFSQYLINAHSSILEQCSFQRSHNTCGTLIPAFLSHAHSSVLTILVEHSFQCSHNTCVTLIPAFLSHAHSSVLTILMECSFKHS